jgi:hypothetical protein
MFTNYKINTKKKRFAFEIIFLLTTTFVCLIIFLTGNYLHDIELKSYYKKEEIIQSKIDSLNDNVFRHRYENLNENQRINDYSYESYKKSIFNDKDSSFRRIIYYRLCDLYSGYQNEKTFEEFIQQFEYDSINKIDEEITNLQLQKEIVSKQFPYSNDHHIIFISILLTILYPLRLIYYLIRWSINTIKETEETSEINKNEPKFDNSKIGIVEINDTLIEENKKENKPKILNYFTFNNEYLNGISYLNRMIISSVTSIIFGIGIYLMLTTIFKRSKSLGFSNVISIVFCVTIPTMFLLNFVLIFIENSNSDFSDNNIFTSILFRLLFGLPHLVLLFKNGTRKKIGKFEIHE